MIPVFFDTNVYRRILIPEEFLHDDKIEYIKKINQALVDKKIQGFLSETIFTLESIKKEDRQEYLANYTLESKVEETKIDFNHIQISIAMGSDRNKAPVLDHNRIKYLEKIKELDLKLIKLPRIVGIPSNIPSEYYLNELNDEKLYQEHHNRKCKLARIIEKKGLGIACIKQLGLQNNSLWHKGLQQVDSKKKVAKAVAEWADGDSVAMCYGYSIPFFCTEDEGKNSGMDSILSLDNRIWLQKDYGVNIVSLKSLCEELKL